MDKTKNGRLIIITDNNREYQNSNSKNNNKLQ